MAGYGGYPMGGAAPPGGQHGMLRYGQPPPQASQHYGAYGQQFHQQAYQIDAHQAMQMNSPDELQQLFASKVTNQSRGIQGHELFEILNQSQSVRQYYKINWSMELCKIMIAMLDRSKDGFMQYSEFEELMRCIAFWHQTFCQYDSDRSGFIEAGELKNVILNKYAYALSPQALEALLKRYSKAMPNGQLLIAFDDFVALSVRLRAYTEAFRARDRMTHSGQETGYCQFSYDDFLQVVMCL